MAGPLPRVGDILDGRYELLRTLGEGGMAVVFEATQRATGQRVAVKVLAPELSRDPEIVARFDREARAVGRLRTRHVAHVIEVAVTDQGVPFMVMDFLDGRDVASELEARGRLPVGEAVDYVLQTAAAMEEAHRAGIVHRDLKPANLFLTSEGTLPCVRVLDFGISKLLGEASKLTGAGAVIGTVIYMSPEQVRSSSDVDQRADIWSLGIILYELLAGRAPFEGPGHMVAIAIVSEDAPDIRSFVDVPAPLAAAIARMLARDRAQRAADMREVAKLLAPFVEPGSYGARAASYLGGSPPRRPSPSFAGRTLPLHKLQQRTVPLGLSRPAPPPSPPPSAPAPAQSDRRKSALAETVLTKNKRRQANLVVVAGIVLGLLAAIGVVLIVLTVLGRDGVEPEPTASAPSALVQPSGGSPPAPPPPLSITSSAPPATTTAADAAPLLPAASTRVAPSPSPAPRPAADGGAKPVPTENPTLL